MHGGIENSLFRFGSRASDIALSAPRFSHLWPHRLIALCCIDLRSQFPDRLRLEESHHGQQQAQLPLDLKHATDGAKGVPAENEEVVIQTDFASRKNSAPDLLENRFRFSQGS